MAEHKLKITKPHGNKMSKAKGIPILSDAMMPRGRTDEIFSEHNLQSGPCGQNTGQQKAWNTKC